MWYWIGAIIVLLIVLEEGLYFLFNRLAFNNKTKNQVNNTPEEESTSTKQRRFRRQKH
ncbi:hypothetical protein [Paucisalibacillus globulus]|uniref:hypothetical protein n=1 Tax=Paucisalibacillus globulus TaxID=351095 RepID=UPI0003F63037|nr:hypothetical protein [Paucisalibacillus globulus]